MIGASTRVVMMSERAAAKQLREHPDLTIFDYGQAQRVVTEATEVVQDGPNTLLYVFAPEGFGRHILVVKATPDGNALFVTSFRRLSADQVKRDRELSRLLSKRK